MRKSLLVVAAALSMSAGDARALAGTFQEDADLLVAWYSGWYNGLAKKHLANPDRAKKLEHEIIVHCKANPGIRVIDAIAVVFKDERMRLGIKMAQ
jgi:hypothetical protein